MSKHQKTGNQVFDYRATFRIFAEKLQRALIFGGALCLVCGVLFYFFAPTIASLRIGKNIFSLSGLALIFVGIGWGFFWRRKLRQDFKKKFRVSS